jgi:hypothetical protein
MKIRLWVRVKKPVWSEVKGLGFEDLRPMTLPINQTGIFTFTYKAKNLFSEILEKYFDNDA